MPTPLHSKSEANPLLLTLWVTLSTKYFPSSWPYPAISMQLPALTCQSPSTPNFSFTVPWLALFSSATSCRLASYTLVARRFTLLVWVPPPTLHTMSMSLSASV